MTYQRIRNLREDADFTQQKMADLLFKIPTCTWGLKAV